MTTDSLSRMRMTTDSPCTLGRVTTRRSTWWPSMLSPTRPSCGTRRSAMSSSAMTLMRLTTPATIARGTTCASFSTPSMRRRTRIESDLRLEVDVRRALLHRLGDDLVRELDDRRVVDRLAQIDDLGLGELVLGAVDEVGDDVLHAPQAADEGLQILTAGDGRPDLHAGHDRDVVHRDHVRRVGHGDEQRALAAVGDRDRVVAARRRGRDQPGRGHVDLERGEVDVLEAVTLGEGPREVVVADRAGRQELLLGRAAGGARGGDRGLDLVRLAEPQLHDDVGEEAWAAGPARGLRDAVPPVALLGREADVLERRCHGGAVVLGVQVGGGVGHGGSSTAARITARSGDIPVHAANECAPWRTRISSPPTTVTPRSRAASSSAVPPGR